MGGGGILILFYSLNSDLKKYFFDRFEKIAAQGSELSSNPIKGRVPLNFSIINTVKQLLFACENFCEARYLGVITTLM